MPWNYKFKTDETDIDQETRTIVRTKDVTAEQREEFTFEQKRKELASLVEQKTNIEVEIVKLGEDIKEAEAGLV